MSLGIGGTEKAIAGPYAEGTGLPLRIFSGRERESDFDFNKFSGLYCRNGLRAVGMKEGVQSSSRDEVEWSVKTA